MSTTVITYSVAEEKPTKNEQVPAQPELLQMPSSVTPKFLDAGFIAFYGFRDANQSMRHVRRHYMKRGPEVHRIALRLNTENESGDSRGTADNITTQESLSLWRCDRALSNKICAILGVTDPEKAIADDISLLDKLWESDLLKHIKVFMWRGNYNIATKLAAVRDRSYIFEMDVT